MIHSLRTLALVAVPLVLAACGGINEDAPAPAPEAPAPVEAPAPLVSEPEAAAPEMPAESPAEESAEESAAVALPETFPSEVPMIEGFTVESVTANDDDPQGFTVVGHAPIDEVAVMNWYLKTWKELGWEEDMLMEQPGNTIIGYHKDSLLAVVEATPAPGGAAVTITTGTL